LDIEEDFSTQASNDEPTIPPPSQTVSDEGLTPDEQAVVWWIVAFTCIFETLHSLSSRAVTWLLKFFGAVFSLLGNFSQPIARMARVFPSTLHRRAQYLHEKIFLPSVSRYVVCPACLSLYDYEHCLQKRGMRVHIKSCNKCETLQKHVPLLKEIVTTKGNRKYYPHIVYPYISLVSSLQALFLRPNFCYNCEAWRQNFCRGNRGLLSDLYDGKLWNDFQEFKGRDFLKSKNIALD